MLEKKFSINYSFQVSRLIGEVHHLSALVDLATDMKSEIKYSSHVNLIEFIFAPTQEIYNKRFERLEPDKLIHEQMWIGTTDENKILKKLMKIKLFLKNALKEKDVDYGKLDYTIETVEYKRYIV